MPHGRHRHRVPVPSWPLLSGGQLDSSPVPVGPVDRAHKLDGSTQGPNPKHQPRRFTTCSPLLACFTRADMHWDCNGRACRPKRSASRVQWAIFASLAQGSRACSELRTPQLPCVQLSRDAERLLLKASTVFELSPFLHRRCGEGEYCVLGSASGQRCPPGATTKGTGSTSLDACGCFANTYAAPHAIATVGEFNASAAVIELNATVPPPPPPVGWTLVCEPCKTGMICDVAGQKLETLLLEPGYWRQSQTSTIIRKCWTPAACITASSISPPPPPLSPPPPWASQSAGRRQRQLTGNMTEDAGEASPPQSCAPQPSVNRTLSHAFVDRRELTRLVTRA